LGHGPSNKKSIEKTRNNKGEWEEGYKEGKKELVSHKPSAKGKGKGHFWGRIKQSW